MILDFSEHLSQTALADVGNSSFNVANNSFFSSRGWCPFCLTHCSLVDSFHNYENLGNSNIFRVDLKVWQCGICGWWELKETERVLDGINQNTFTQRLKHGVLKKYAPSSFSIPINTLKTELAKRENLIYSIHYKKMEELVKSILSDFYNCEVHHVGKTGDQGVDLILIKNDSPILIQVKRRTKPNRAEPVREIREFLGAVKLHESNSKEAIFVTSADRYTKRAQLAASSAIDKNLVNRFDLVDLNSLLSMMDISSGHLTTPWKDLSSWLESGTS
jgi:restriction system protein